MTTVPTRALLLDGRVDDSPTQALMHAALIDGLSAAGWAVDDWTLRDETIAWCAGCFGCWVATPGVCVHTDAGRDVAARVTRAGLLVYLTPVTFGGYSSQLKKALDHVIPIVLPDLKKTGGDTRHPHRYPVAHDLLVLGSVPSGAAAERQAATFRKLVARNCLNLRPARCAVEVLEEGADHRAIGETVAGLLARVGASAAPGQGPRTEEMVA